MSLLVKARRGVRDIVAVTPQSAGWSYVGFSAHRLAAGETLALDTGARELCIVILSGTVDLEAGAQRWPGVGGRASVFEDAPPRAAYVPGGCAVRIAAVGAAEVALCTAPATSARAPRLLDSGSMRRSVRGSGANTRYVRDILPETEAADHLLVVEVLTPAGHSSSYPPHKHDADDIPRESALEETYYHRLDPAQGFAFQRVYTDDRTLDEAMAVEDHDVVMVPRGYHPVTMPYGYNGYYLNVMAGATRRWHFRNDPAHEWMLDAAVGAHGGKPRP